MSGVVEETFGRLEYEVALYKEAPGTISNKGLPAGNHHFLNHSAQALMATQNELPLDQAVPIGTKLQLRARISLLNVWKNVKLMEVTVSRHIDFNVTSLYCGLVRYNNGYVCYIIIGVTRCRQCSCAGFCTISQRRMSKQRFRFYYTTSGKLFLCFSFF